MNELLKRLLFGRLMAPNDEAGSGGGGEFSGSGGGGSSGSGGSSDTITMEQLLQKFNDLEVRHNKVVEQNTQLFNEAKKAKDAAKSKTEEERKLKEQKDREAGNFKSLLEASETAKSNAEKSLQDFQSKYKREKATTFALQIARELTDPSRPDDASLLAELIKSRLDYDLETDKPIVLDESGQETFASLDDLKKEVDTNRRFATLLKSSQRSGGGAAGSKGGALGSKTMTRTEYEALSPIEKSNRVKDGWKIV